jgi:hypothetical protein
VSRGGGPRAQISVPGRADIQRILINLVRFPTMNVYGGQSFKLELRELLIYLLCCEENSHRCDFDKR